MDPKAQQAAEHHRLAQAATGLSEQHRATRDRLVQELWLANRADWTYAKLAEAVGCSPELIAKIITGRTSR